MNIQEYSVALATSLERSKNPSSVAREIGTSQSSTSRFLKALNINEFSFVPLVKSMFGKRKFNLVIDDTTISKRYSKDIEGVSSMVDQATKTFTYGYKIATAGLTDGKYFLPIGLEQWVAEFIMKRDYLSVIQLAERLIARILNLKLAVEFYVMDGLYFSQEFIKFLEDSKLKFVIKAKTTTCVTYKGKKIQLQHCKELRLNSNQSQKKIKALWHGEEYYFIAVRRSGKHGPTIIYLIANFNAKAKVYARIYESRWKIEKFHRTSKQFLGLKDSLSLEATTYLNHIKCVFFSYGLLQLLMKKFKLDSVENAIRKAQALKFKHGFTEIAHQISLLENYA